MPVFESGRENGGVIEAREKERAAIPAVITAQSGKEEERLSPLEPGRGGTSRLPAGNVPLTTICAGLHAK